MRRAWNAQRLDQAVISPGAGINGVATKTWLRRADGLVIRPSETDELFETLACFADLPVRQYRAFVDEIGDQFDRIPSAVAAQEPLVMSITFTVSIEEGLPERFAEELHRTFG